ncbi:MAG: hypothetical protein H6703_17070 [Myxococcales bacterium]|nr:hypothetical protein [Myxococcales bacterium]MCB9552730.1 hypothetical protein [Myxococcales bacterium]
MRRLLLGLALGGAALVGCTEEAAAPEVTPLEVGDSREVTLRFTPLDVSNFQKTLARLELRQLPPRLIERTWLTDIDLRGAPDGAPQLIDHALEAILSLDPTDPTLEPAKRNLVALLQMSPQTADLSGTSMEALLELAPNIGFSVPEVLGLALGVEPDQAFLSPADVGAAMVEFVIGSHPNARVRPGPITPSNPEGLYPVAPGKLPVFLDDVLSDLRTLQRRYGPYAAENAWHPGFIAGPVEATLFEEDLVMVVKANTNGAPDKGIDLETASIAGVNSIDDSPETLFDFSDPDWLNIEGSFVDPPRIGRMLFALGEDPRFIRGGTNPEPAPRGDGEVWAAAPYTLERVVAEAAFARWRDHTVYEEITRRAEGEPLLTLDVDHGWLSLATPGRVGEPPPATYIWDLITEVAQIRVHDGDIPEGEANVSFVLEDVALGLSMADLIGGVKRSLQADPAGLVQVAATLFDNTWGEADFFYRRPRGEDADYLFFIDASDIPKDRAGVAVRPYAYQNPGFFADPALTMQLATRDVVDGDAVHLKLRVSPGDVFYVADEGDRVFRVTVGEKPSRATLPLTIERVR